MNVLPGFTTRLALDRQLTKDSRSLFIQDFQCNLLLSLLVSVAEI